MSKDKIKYVCSQCGFESIKWIGKCPSCNEWNSFSEEFVEKSINKNKPSQKKALLQPLNKIEEIEEPRFATNITEFDRVLGGGLIKGSVVLIGGDPGIGKSTLVLQAAAKINGTVLYVTGEESIQQINIRAKRLKIKSNNILILSETNLNIITDIIKEQNPSVVVIDSIQTMFRPEMDNGTGTVTQIRESTLEIMQYAKLLGFAAILIGHITKEGIIAGPKVLEHIVDAVLQFEGEQNYSYRILRAQKNRYGSTNEIGIFEMKENGLEEVNNPSELFIGEREKAVSGSIIASSMEGTRPLLLEVQSLVTPTHFGNPQRVATGFDYRRLSILLAVLEKRAGLKLSVQNVFLNMAGGLRIEEPAIDLAVCLAIASGLINIPAKHDTVVIGEVGLGGEIRRVSHIEKRIQEAEKLGFKNAIIPKNNIKSLKNSEMNIIPVDYIRNAIDIAFK